jgi:hypothetical protein
MSGFSVEWEFGAEHDGQTRSRPTRARPKRNSVVARNSKLDPETGELLFTLTMAYHPSIATEAANSYATAIEVGWTAIANEEIIWTDIEVIGKSKYLAGSGADLYLAPCDDNCGEAGRGAAGLGGRILYYSPTQFPDTPVHEFKHILGFSHEGFVRPGSILSAFRSRSVTPGDVHGVYRLYTE